MTAALPAILAVLLLQFIFLLVESFPTGGLENWLTNERDAFGSVIAGFGIIAAMMAGVICGSEEHENDTADRRDQQEYRRQRGERYQNPAQQP